jgi:hypothetical protein
MQTPGRKKSAKSKEKAKDIAKPGADASGMTGHLFMPCST